MSLNSSWVPSSDTISGSGGGGTAPNRSTGGGSFTGGGNFSRTPGGIGQWAYTGHPAYGMSDFGGDRYSGFFGNCTWYAWYRHQNEPLMQLGNAGQWAYSMTNSA